MSDQETEFFRYGDQVWTFEEVNFMAFESVLDSTECPECGSTQRVEPDASNYTCHGCGEGRVHSPLWALGFV